MDWGDFSSGGIGALFGSIITIIGFRGRLTLLEKRYDDLKEECKFLRQETLFMFEKIQEDCKDSRQETLSIFEKTQGKIEKLLVKTAERRKD